MLLYVDSCEENIEFKVLPTWADSHLDYRVRLLQVSASVPQHDLLNNFPLECLSADQGMIEGP